MAAGRDKHGGDDDRASTFCRTACAVQRCIPRAQRGRKRASACSVWFRCAVLWSSHLPGPLHINARQGAVYWCRQHGTRGARTSTSSYVPAEVLPVPEGYVPSTIDESAQQQKWGSRIGGEHHGAGLWHLYSTLAAPLASCCLLQRRRRLGCGSSECRWLIPAGHLHLPDLRA